MVDARRAVLEADALAPTLSFIQWHGREYLRIETERGVFFHDGEKVFTASSPADTFEPGTLVRTDQEELRPQPQAPDVPDVPDQGTPGQDVPDPGPPASGSPEPHTPPEIDPEPEVAHPEDEDPSPGW